MPLRARLKHDRREGVSQSKHPEFPRLTLEAVLLFRVRT